MPDQAPSLHWGDRTVAPVALHRHLFIAPDVVDVPEVGAGGLGVWGERGAADKREVMCGDPLAGEGASRRIIGGGGGGDGGGDVEDGG